MNIFIFLICFIIVPPTIGNNLYTQNTLELDRARSTWNFGGHNPIKRTVYLNKPKNVAGPGSIIANRRSGSGSAPMAPHRITKKSQSGIPQRRRQYKSYSKPGHPGRPITKRNAHFPFSMQPSTAMHQGFSMPYYSTQQRSSSTLPSWHRTSRKLQPTVDTIKSRFMKEDLWHLDKGESYIVKDEDLERDKLLRNRNNYETNEIDHEINMDHEEQNYLHQLEKDAENMVNQAENPVNSSDSSEKGSSPQHVHHHHHYEIENVAKSTKAHKKKPADNNKLTPVPIPRIHNPIPLGCLLTVPVFHPVRPRHHLACLLSIPGTPSLTRRRRKRSADFTQVQIPTQAQSQSLFQQLFGSNSRMTPIVTRKHYTSHVGNGKTPSHSSPSALSGNYKVPATIIAPPKFNKDDVLAMLLGSGGISADKMGTIVATENRYVRFGRGLPSNRGGSRQGRNLQWSADPSVRASSTNSIPVPVKGHAMEASSSNYTPTVGKYTPPVQPAKKPIVHLTPVPKTPSNYTPPHKIASQPLPLILNVQISPMPPQRHTSGPVITVPIQQHSNLKQQNFGESTADHDHYKQQQQPTSHSQEPQQSAGTELHKQQSNIEVQLQQQESSMETQQSNSEHQLHSINDHKEQKPNQEEYFSPSPKLKKFDKFKYSDWRPLDLGKPKPQKAYKFNTEPSESKLHYRKIKSPMLKGKKAVTNAPIYYESINDKLADADISSIDFLSGYYEDPIDLGVRTLDSTNSGDADQYLFDPTEYLTQNNGMNNDVNGANYVSYAVKKNFKDELDSVLNDISNMENVIYSNSGFAENYDVGSFHDAYDNYNGRASSSNIDNDNIYSQEKYYTVKKIPDQLPDPIFISVPKDSGFSNELYDVRK